MADRELYLIDGNSLAYRAFFALPDTIATSRGEPREDGRRPEQRCSPQRREGTGR